ncbi:hypothetical protein [Streptococcus ruminantium]|uniref:hypothetical protein n=1 Tax=Streptococcus ruminantium TaxID=1917441 RepID=UPI001F472FBB|nr:hypothetical protein [Streptococcus ruminantium]BDD37930.1 hypothetical protein GUT183_01680 [Streptococcus ruminantium]
MTKSEQVLEMFDQVLNGRVSVWDFSFDFGEWLASEQGDLLEEENEPVFDLLNDNIPLMLEELEDYTLDANRAWLQEYRDNIAKLI